MAESMKYTYDVACPVCLSDVGQVCRNASGGVTPTPHPERVEASDEAGFAPEPARPRDAVMTGTLRGKPMYEAHFPTGPVITAEQVAALQAQMEAMQAGINAAVVKISEIVKPLLAAMADLDRSGVVSWGTRAEFSAAQEALTATTRDALRGEAADED